MDIRVRADKLCGEVILPSSKSAAHRAMIAAAIAKGESRISGVTHCDDTYATIGALTALGAKISVENDTVTVRGIDAPAKSAVIDCGESGSTLRFMIPIAAAYGTDTVFTGHGKLPQRPLDDIIDALQECSVGSKRPQDSNLPLEMHGKLSGDMMTVAGNISSQYLTGALFSSMIGGQRVRLSTALQSAPYVDMTVDMIKKFGGNISFADNIYTPGGRLTSRDIRVEADWSAAAFFFEMAALGADIVLDRLDPHSRQGDKQCVDIFKNIGVSCRYEKGKYILSGGTLSPIDMDASATPDMVPAVAVTLAFANGTSTVYNARRLRIKESDRLLAIAVGLDKMGIKCELFDDRLIIHGGTPHMACIDSFNDHRIAMAFAGAAAKTGEMTVCGAQSVAKSFPGFFSVINSIGGVTDVINNG